MQRYWTCVGSSESSLERENRMQAKRAILSWNACVSVLVLTAP